MDGFLAEVAPRAFVMTRSALRNSDDAMDIVQDAMFKLVSNYSDRPSAEWAPLFYRILQSKIRDWMRREKVRGRVRGWFGGSGEGEDSEDLLQQVPDPRAQTPLSSLQQQRQNSALVTAVGQLPDRQRQVFLLRAWEGLDVAQTARAMGCSAGSVKTHYFRAVRALRTLLEGEWS